jgi:GT2 family glycosyltransferase
MTPSVAAVVLNWNNWELTQNCVNSLFRSSCVPDIVVVVDNDSSDDSPAKLKKFLDGRCSSTKAESEAHLVGNLSRFPDKEFVLILASHNNGFAAGNNIGISWLVSNRSTEFMWILNNDTEVHSSCLASITEQIPNYPDVEIWGSTIVSSDTGLIQYGGGGFYNPITSMAKPYKEGLGLETLSDVSCFRGLDYISGAAMLVKAELFQRTSGFEESFFLYYEELDLAKKLTPMKMAWCPSSVVYHQGSATIGGSHSEIAQYHENLSTFKFTALNYPLYLPFVMTIRIFGKPLILLASKRARLIPTVYRASFDFFNWLIFDRKQ